MLSSLGEKSAPDGDPGSCANHTGVRTPTPVLRKVSRFRYLALANCPIASGIVDNLCKELIASCAGLRTQPIYARGIISREFPAQRLVEVRQRCRRNSKRRPNQQARTERGAF